MFNRRQVLASLGALGTCTYGTGFGRRRRSATPNVLLIVVDDLRPQLGCYGLPHVRSPNIDAFAREGVLFQQARAQVALCTPSRCCMLSGLRPDTTGIYELKHTLAGQAPTALSLPRYFRANGYRTVSLGKVYHHGEAEDPGAWTEPPWDPGNHMFDYLDPASIDIVRRSKKYKGGDGRRGPSGEAADVPDEAYGDGKILERALAELRRPQKAPLFLAVGFHRPHMPQNAPRRYWDLYDPEALPLPSVSTLPKRLPSIAVPSHRTDEYTDMPLDGTRSEADLRHLLHGYHACVSYVDALIGRLLEGLDDAGLAEDTTVVLVGDHGMHLGDHGLWGKHSNFDMAAWAPLIIRHPGSPRSAGRTVEPLVELVDIFPTLCETASLPIPEGLEGDSLVPLMEREQRRWKSAVFWQYFRRGVMGHTIRTRAWRYTRYQRMETGEAVGAELYDHRTDPDETENLWKKADRDVLADLNHWLDLGWAAARPDQSAA